MSESSLAATSDDGSKVFKISEAVIRIAGNSQDGIQAIGGFLARLAGRSEQEVMTFMTIPSTISGGPSIFQVRIGSGEVLSAGDEADVLLAEENRCFQELDELKRLYYQEKRYLQQIEGQRCISISELGTASSVFAPLN